MKRPEVASRPTLMIRMRMASQVLSRLEVALAAGSDQLRRGDDEVERLDEDRQRRAPARGGWRVIGMRGASKMRVRSRTFAQASATICCTRPPLPNISRATSTVARVKSLK